MLTYDFPLKMLNSLRNYKVNQSTGPFIELS